MPRRVYTYQPGSDWATLNLIETVGAYVLLVGLSLTLFNVLWSRRSGAIAGDNPWGGETLEWATASPPEPYNFAVVPTVHSLHPMWDGRTLATMERDTGDPERALDDGKQGLRTSDLDGEPEHALPLPEESLAPLVTALGMLVVTLGLLLGWYVVAVLGVVVTAVGLMVWMWPEREPEEAAA
jgi:cytochrome c oxidase subunit 1/cytochrome c oxidase subunit I+III